MHHWDYTPLAQTAGMKTCFFKIAFDIRAHGNNVNIKAV